MIELLMKVWRLWLEPPICHNISMKYVILFMTAIGLMIGLMSCAPKVEIQRNVIPSLLSVTVPQQRGGQVVLQGRYFGDGQGGLAENSYVVLGADSNAQGGVRISPNSWSPSKILLDVPTGAGHGFVFVVVDGVISNGVPANMP